MSTACFPQASFDQERPGCSAVRFALADLFFREKKTSNTASNATRGGPCKLFDFLAKLVSATPSERAIKPLRARQGFQRLLVASPF
jgi:hypothetical protein